jgi:archaellum component FlaC
MIEEQKEEFRGKELSKFIPTDLECDFNVLYKSILDDEELGKISFTLIKNPYENIKKGIIERFSSLEGIDELTSKLDYIFNRIKRDLIDNKIDDIVELEIFIDALKNNFEEFKVRVQEIDKKFE